MGGVLKGLLSDVDLPRRFADDDAENNHAPASANSAQQLSRVPPVTITTQSPRITLTAEKTDVTLSETLNI